MKFHIFRLNLSDRYSNPCGEGKGRWGWTSMEKESTRWEPGQRRWSPAEIAIRTLEHPYCERDCDCPCTTSFEWTQTNHVIIYTFVIFGTWSDLREVVLWCFYPLYLISREEGYPDKSLGDLLLCYSSLVRDLTAWARENPLINETDTNSRKKPSPNSSVKNDRTEKERIMRNRLLLGNWTILWLID